MHGGAYESGSRSRLVLDNVVWRCVVLGDGRLGCFSFPGFSRRFALQSGRF